jgi:transmembrane sensor
MHITEALIRKFFDDTCTPEEADAVAGYFKENPYEMKKYLGGDWMEAGREEGREDAPVIPMISHTRRKPKRSWLAWTAAAAVVVALGLTTLKKQTKEKPTLAARTAVTPPPLENPWIDQTASGDEEKKLILSDGSVVTLCANSNLRYQDPFPAGVREVTLEGQATFDVARDVRKPFRVKAGATTTTVLGTRFNVLENAGGVMVRLMS